MAFISLHYLYRDYSNYKRHGSVIFSNPNHRSVEEIDAVIRKHLIDEQWFVHTTWGLPDLHFEKTDWETDHAWHEYSHVELSTESSKPDCTIEELFSRLRGE